MRHIRNSAAMQYINLHLHFAIRYVLFALLAIIFGLCLIPGDDEKKKRQERLRKNRPSINSGSSKTPRESTKTSDKEVAEPVSVPSTGSDSGIDSTPIVIVPETAPVTDITSVHGSEASAPVVSELNAETTNLLSMSKLVRLGKDGLSSSLSADLLSVIENSIGGTVTATLAADGPDLMRTLTTDEERVIQELVQVGIYAE